VKAIDAVRGFAIVAMCISHVGELIQLQLPAEGQWMRWLGLVATPAFLLLSGVSSAYVLKPDANVVRRVRFIDRALFLLVVAHPIISLCHVYDQPGDWRLAFASVYITDVVALALCLAVLMRAASGKTVLSIGLLLCVLTWPVAWYWRPATPLTDIADQILFHGGMTTPVHIGYTVPIVAYLGLYMIGFGMSRTYRSQIAAGGVSGSPGCVLPLALAMIAAAVMLKLFALLSRSYLDADTYTMLWRIVDPRLKLPPGPGYLLLFSGVTLLIYALVVRLQFASSGSATVNFLSTLGRASLVTYLLQEVTIYLVPRFFAFASIHSLSFWIGYLTLTIGIAWLVARAWTRRDGNRWISVGLTALARRFVAPAASN
jgi:uncharacterized membrane protein